MIKNKKKNGTALSVYLIPAVICFFFSLVFRFSYVGHRMLALVFAGIGIMIMIYYLIKCISKRNKNTARIIRTIISGLLFLGIGAFALAEIQVIGAAGTDDEPEADFLIVLGAGVNGTVPSLSLQNRLDAALEYMLKYPHSIAVVSGGQGPGEAITEAEAMFGFLVDSGIEKERIIKEEKAVSTKENLSYSLELIKEETGEEIKKVAIVSSEYHLYRAKTLAKRLGLDPVGVAAETSMPTLKLNHFIREAFGAILLFFGS